MLKSGKNFVRPKKFFTRDGERNETHENKIDFKPRFSERNENAKSIFSEEREPKIENRSGTRTLFIVPFRPLPIAGLHNQRQTVSCVMTMKFNFIQPSATAFIESKNRNYRRYQLTFSAKDLKKCIHVASYC